ncbi:MAG: C/D box methylation guide ribonucleoprotein complex aNOP56 subunit [Thermoprotei archaeon]|nr:MAG: C/D box methylation guide ribonucleoprotein complex aNOP56 subunit [Thermoprotei archaeon]
MGLRGYLTCSPAGLLILGDEGEVIAARRWPKDLEKAADEMMILEEGGVPETLVSLIEEATGLDEIIVEDPDLGKSLAEIFKGSVMVKPNNEVAALFRERFPDYLESLGVSVEEYRKLVHEMSLHLTRRKVRKAAEKRDLFVAQAISALDDVNKTLNLFASRIREWYSLHFPEMDELVDEHEDFVRIVSKVGHRGRMSVEVLRDLGLDEELAEKLASAAKRSMGADMTEFDLAAIRLLSDAALQLYDVRRGLEKYIDEAMMEVAPNIRGLVGPLLGARLIALAGGLSKLAALPASTIQVLGAEKALFRALRTGGRPPKHGVIFQHPAIHRSPRWQRGKIARALAAKLAIAARIDAFTGEYKADELKEQLEQRIKEIKTLYAKPPRRPSAPPRRGRERRKRRRRR